MTVILETAVVLARLDRRDLKDGAVALAMLRPSVATEFFEELFCSGHRAAHDKGLGLSTAKIRTLRPALFAEVAASAGFTPSGATAIQLDRAVLITDVRVDAFGKFIVIDTHSENSSQKFRFTNPSIYDIIEEPSGPAGLSTGQALRLATC